MPGKPHIFRPRTVSSKVTVDNRPSARERGYTAEWDKAARSFKFAHPLCLGCQAFGTVAATEVVDHIEPHRGDPQLFWDRGNWQSSCAWHHDKVKQELERRFDRGQVGAAALRLDSPLAVKLSREMIESGEGPR